ncbi:MAG: class I SAM-dependent methyltransferase [Pseudobdellovibrionaceae bacterium]
MSKTESNLESNLKLNLENPFPLLAEGSISYRKAQEHSALVDIWLGFNTEEIEKKLLKSQPPAQEDAPVQAWIGLPVQAMQTPYTEIRSILNILNPQPQEFIIDLGCAYGRMAHVLGRHFPHVQFLGYELVDERVQEGNRVLQKFNYPSVILETRDLATPGFTPRSANHYFIFDFGSQPAVEKTLEDLRNLARKKNISVIARGRGIRHWIYQGHPWLYAMNEPQTFEHFTIFRS